jgi:tetratricopeptide (TPR) repeat protein
LAAGQPIVSEYQRDLAQSYNQIGVAKENMGLLDEALASYEKSLRIYQPIAQANTRGLQGQYNLGQVSYNIGNVHQKARRPVEALASFANARQVLAKLVKYNPTVPQYQRLLATALNNLGYQYRLLGQFDDALRQYDEALPLLEGLVRDHPANSSYPELLVMTAINRGRAYRELRRPTEAVAQFERVLEILKARPSLGRLAETYADLGRAYLAVGRPEDAFHYCTEAVTQRRRSYQENPNDRNARRGLADSLHHLGVVQREEGQPEAARVSHQEARTLREELAKKGTLDDRSDLGAICNELGQDLLVLNRKDEALQAFTQARDHQRAAFDEAPQFFKYCQGLTEALERLVQLYDAMGQKDKADEWRKMLEETKAAAKPPA